MVSSIVLISPRKLGKNPTNPRVFFSVILLRFASFRFWFPNTYALILMGYRFHSDGVSHQILVQCTSYKHDPSRLSHVVTACFAISSCKAGWLISSGVEAEGENLTEAL